MVYHWDAGSVQYTPSAQTTSKHCLSTHKLKWFDYNKVRHTAFTAVKPLELRCTYTMQPRPEAFHQLSLATAGASGKLMHTSHCWLAQGSPKATAIARLNEWNSSNVSVYVDNRRVERLFDKVEYMQGHAWAVLKADLE